MVCGLVVSVAAMELDLEQPGTATDDWSRKSMAEFQQTLFKGTDIWISYTYLLSNIILLLK